MEYRSLGKTNLKVSALSFGASSLGAMFHAIDENAGIRTVHLAIDAGVNLIDVAPYYGMTKAETVLGRALRTVPRDKYILATKCGRYGAEIKDFDFSADRVTRSVDESLGRLGVEYLDIIQVHDVEFGNLDQIATETLPALRQVQRAGKARFVGITALPIHALRYIAERADVDTILSYCHYELNDTALEGLVPFLKQKNIGVINASPLGMGLLSHRGTPTWHPAPPAVRDACKRAADHVASRGEKIEKLAVQFSVAHPDIATTLVGTADPENMQRNIEWAQQRPDAQLLAEVMEILKPAHNITWPSGRPENYPPELRAADSARAGAAS